MKKPTLLDALQSQVLLCDGAMGSQVQAMTLEVEADFLGCENCTEILNRSRPDVVKAIHQAYLDAGSDCIQTNSFGASPITLAEFGLEADAFELNVLAAQLARSCADETAARTGQARFVLGSIGPGTKLPSLGHLAYEALLEGFTLQAQGLAAGGVDGFLIETCQDPLQIKAAIEACKRACPPSARLPIFVQVTVETTGTLLVGTDIGGVMGLLSSMEIDALGMNCATGPKEMETHIATLAEGWGGHLFIQPNAGLPCLKHGRTHYDLTPEDLAGWMKGFVPRYGLNLIGGCCGTTPAHIAALDALLRSLAPSPPAGEGWGEGEVAHRPAPTPRRISPPPCVASLYAAQPLRQENAFFAIGERCNANGSKAFRDAQAAEDWDTCLNLALEQQREGSHALDICTAFVGRNEVADMSRFITQLRGSVQLPLVLDSTELPVLEAGLALYGGKAILNSINFEDGDAPAVARMRLARQHGAAVIALTIEEAGMAKSVEDKLRITRRLVAFADAHGLPRHDLLIDPLTFTICTGNEDDRPLGYWTLDAIEAIAAEFPDIQIVLGLSNISFGLNPTARRILNSVYLHEAVSRGMTGAIVHASKIMPLHQIDPAHRDAALDLIYDRTPSEGTALQHFMGLMDGLKPTAGAKKDPLAHLPTGIEDRLKRRIVDGIKLDLATDLDLALQTYAPLDIINTLLLDGMKVVGELFGSGQLQLPFVLQSAETMKAAVAYLEPFMERVEGQHKGKVLLATVKGDVHDIGKNLVDIILTNNGYKVENIGIKQPIDAILKAAEAFQPDAIGLSGLLVKSTVIMQENVRTLAAAGWQTPVFLGGAALTRPYVEQDCFALYPQVAYVKDAFESLMLMARIAEGSFEAYCQDRAASYEASETPHPSPLPQGERGQELSLSVTASHGLPADSIRLPASLWAKGSVVESPALAAVLPYLNRRRLFERAWGFAPPEAGESEAAWEARWELPQRLDALLADPELQGVLTFSVVWRPLWLQPVEEGLKPSPSPTPDAPCVSIALNEGEDAVATWETPWVLAATGEAASGEAASLATLTHPQGDAAIGFAITLGEAVEALAHRWFASDNYQQYLFLHGLLGELTEASVAWLKASLQQQGQPALHRIAAGGELLPEVATQGGLLNALDPTGVLGLHYDAETQGLNHGNATTGLWLQRASMAPWGW